ncbi:hypothetical protein [Pedobacter sp. SL55]|uniref:hypothetical protein n=1 Tax=Pedobacter sp. SL55 TaxID=2995161 RepID=UPI00226FC85B|nr:hypothetical protein [Pedobacter sp. SL55]WAC39795.1 hypothetical protein OVA16_14575 [Pedobacter sp. SL55]
MGCKKNKGSEQVGQPPKSVTLLLPKSDEVCALGPITADKSKISFSWSRDENSDRYEVIVRDLKTGNSSTHETTDTKLDISLSVNTPFSWYVRSKSLKNSASAQSTIWKFYTSGPGIASFAPFPADKLVPTLKQDVTAVNGKVTLSWVGSHVDNNILGYDIYLSENMSNLILIKENQVSSPLTIDVAANKTYFWKVITKDKNGNKSDSGLYQFTVL